jgi:GNAT superfamily N-acetyltransferase
MQIASYKDKNLVVSILSKSFDENKSVNYLIKQDKKRAYRIRKLMHYSFDMCYWFGQVFMSEDKKGCALIIMPDKKKTTLKSIVSDIKLVVGSTGLTNIRKAIRRESKIMRTHPKGLIYYLWFIGVEPNEQAKGIGSKLMEDLIVEAKSMKRTICLETSTLKNVPWYEKFGFRIYKELNFGYKLFCMKKD